MRIFDLDTSDSFLLPMSQTKKDEKGSDAIKTVEEKDSVVNFQKSRSIMDRTFDSDEELAITVDDSDLMTNPSATISAPKAMEVFTSLAYCSENQTLCAGTNHGNLYIWRRNVKGISNAIENTTNGYESMEDFWHLVNIANVRGAIKHCSWGVCDVSTPCVLVNCISNVFILKVTKKVKIFNLFVFSKIMIID